MKFKGINLNIILAMTMLLMGFAGDASCAVLSSDIIAKKIKQDITEQLKQHHSGKIEVEVPALPYQQITLPDGNVTVKAETDLERLDSSIIQVNIFVNGVKAKTFGARVNIKVYDKVWVAQDWIKRGETLRNLKSEEKNISSVLNEAVSKDFEPGKYIARRNIKPGDIINKAYIEPVPEIIENSPVSLIFKTPYVSITIPAIAVSRGGMGDFIKVSNKEYRKNYVGKVIGKNLVLVNI